MKNIIFIIALLLCSYCTAQAPDSIKYYNAQKYKDWNRDSEYLSSYSEDDKFLMKGNERVRIWKHNDKVIHVEISNKVSPYTYFYAYNSKNKLIIGSYITFYQTRCGLDIDYDAKGNIVKAENLDAPYLLSIEDMVKKFKKEYNIDLLNRKNVSRFYRSEFSPVLGIPLFEIWLKTEIENEWVEYLVDGKSGKTLYMMENSEGDNKESVLREYLKSIGKPLKPAPKYDASRD